MPLNLFGSLPPVASYQLGGKTCEIPLVELVIGVLIVGFAFLYLLPRFAYLAFDRKYLPIGEAVWFRAFSVVCRASRGRCAPPF